MFHVSAIDTEKLHRSAENFHPKLKNTVKGVVEIQYGKGVLCFKKVQSMTIKYHTIQSVQKSRERCHPTWQNAIHERFAV